MKKTLVILTLLCSILTIRAQHQIYPFFDDKGQVRIESQELNDAADTLISVFHRADDIVWSRVVYRIIDLRYKQNYQLYFPLNSDDPQYRSLFKVIIDAVADGLEVYPKAADNIKPIFDEPLSKTDIPGMLMIDDVTADYSDDSTHYDISSSSAMLLHYDKEADKLKKDGGDASGLITKLKERNMDYCLYTNGMSLDDNGLLSIADELELARNDTYIPQTSRELVRCIAGFDAIASIVLIVFSV